MERRQTAITLIYLEGGVGDVDATDIMRKSVYDQDGDNVVDKINKLTDIVELQTAIPGYIPKALNATDTGWDEDEQGSGDAVGGTI